MLKKFKKNFKKNEYRNVFILICIFTGMVFSIPYVYATDDPIEVINNLSELIYRMIKIIGTVIAVFGVFQFGMSFKSHDPSQRSTGVLTAVGGLIMAFSREIVTIITN